MRNSIQNVLSFSRSNASVSIEMLLIPLGTSLPNLFNHNALIFTAAAPLMSLLTESPMWITSSGLRPVPFNASSNNSHLGLYDLASSEVKTPEGFIPRYSIAFRISDVSMLETM